MNQIDYENLGSRMKELRIKMKLTQAEVAKALNVTPGYISTHPISSRLLSRFCKIRNPASREKIDSMLIRIQAATAGRPRCVKNCKV